MCRVFSHWCGLISDFIFCNFFCGRQENTRNAENRTFAIRKSITLTHRYQTSCRQHTSCSKSKPDGFRDLCTRLIKLLRASLCNHRFACGLSMQRNVYAFLEATDCVQCTPELSGREMFLRYLILLGHHHLPCLSERTVSIFGRNTSRREDGRLILNVGIFSSTVTIASF